MRKPNDPAARSFAPAGSVADMSEMEIRVVVTSDVDDTPIGVLEYWDTGCWMYAEVDSLRPVEPEQ